MDNFNNYYYKTFDKFVFRTPYFPIKRLIRWLPKLDNSQDYLKDILSYSEIKEAIFLASPELYSEILKYQEDRLCLKDKKKFFFSVVKYISRMTTRCTPFGIFAGCSYGYFGSNSDIKLPTPDNYITHTRLDMDYLCALVQNIVDNEDVKYRLLYYPNTTCYVVGDTLRYISYQYINGKRKHNISSVDYSDYLQRILDASQNGSTIAELKSHIVSDDINDDTASEFIHELINLQILRSELECGVTGHEQLSQLILSLQKYDDLKFFTTKLIKISASLQEIDSAPFDLRFPIYESVKKQIEDLHVPYNPKYLFQCDMFKPSLRASLSKEVEMQLLEVITVLNKIPLVTINDTLLSSLAKSFCDKYEDREVSILQMLDIDIGLDFKQLGSDGDSTLINDIPYTVPNTNINTFNWDSFQSRLFQKILDAICKKDYIVKLVDADFRNLESHWDDMPPTIAVMCEIFSGSSDNPPLIYVNSIGGSSAANLLSRFCYLNNNIMSLVQDITHYEENSIDDKIIAEIVHLPESRVGNILARPVLRKYEIPFLANTGVGKKFQINLKDLVVSVRGGKFVLRSKKLNKEIIPMLTSSHNYSYKPMPIYEFLCKLQHQNIRGSIGLRFSEVFDELIFIPRISYKNTIISLARWKIFTDDFKQIGEANTQESAKIMAKKWKKNLKLKRFVVLPDGDNDLFIDTNSITSLLMLYNEVKKRPFFFLREFPFDIKKSIIQSKEGAFVNEFIFAFHK